MPKPLTLSIYGLQLAVEASVAIMVKEEKRSVKSTVTGWRPIMSEGKARPLEFGAGSNQE